MFPRWLWLNHVPAGLSLTPEQYADVKRRVRALGSSQRRFTPMSRRMLVRLIPSTLLLSMAFVVWILWLVRTRPGGTGWMIFANVTGSLMFQGLIWAAIAWSINRAIAPLVWQALNQSGFRVCEGCGYIVENLPRDQGRCPECGHTLHPPVAPEAQLPPT